MTTKLKGLTQVSTGNGEPDLYSDAQRRAYWSDGTRVTSEDWSTEEEREFLEGALAAHGLTLLDARIAVACSVCRALFEARDGANACDGCAAEFEGGDA